MAMTPKEQLDIIAAHIAGEEIQYTGCWDSNWAKAMVCTENHQFNFADRDYRKKPKPLELWVNIYGHDSAWAYLSLEAAKEHFSGGGRTVHMREVLGD